MKVKDKNRKAIVSTETESGMTATYVRPYVEDKKAQSLTIRRGKNKVVLNGYQVRSLLNMIDSAKVIAA
jgi:hypothetical protein